MLRLSIMRGWLQAKMGQRGAAMTEYALILAFVVIIASIALATTGSDNIGSNLQALFKNVGGFLGNSAEKVPAGKSL